LSRNNKKIKAGIISLGCPRNLVDSEIMLGALREDGFVIVDINEADVGIVNTCAFIDEAKRESIDIILKLAELKKTNKLKALMVAGCLPQRFGDGLLDILPEVDAFIGCDEILKAPAILRRLAEGGRLCRISPNPSFIYSHLHPRIRITPGHYAYIKISEGCDNRCSFCIVPSIKGGYRSRPVESVLSEVRGISNEGRLSEINLVGQDTTFYGKDLYGKPALGELLRQLCAFKDYRRWVRLLYMYPAHIDDELIDIFAGEQALCKYIDLPVQHINDGILKRMNRRMRSADILRLIKKLRTRIPDVVLRSSVIVGFPGESDEDFKELVAFIKETKFERLGVFTYSREEGTSAYNYGDQLGEDVKLERFNTLMEFQKGVAAELNKTYLGRTLEVLIDEKDENSEAVYIGRTQGDAPEVDGEVFVKGPGLKPGDFVKVKITDTLEYDLVGERIV